MEFLSLFVGVVSVLVCSIGFEGIEVGFSTSLPVRMHVRVRWVDDEVHMQQSKFKYESHP